MKKSYLIALALALAITGWMVAGQFTTQSKSEAAVGQRPPAQTPNLMTVEVKIQKARHVAQHIVAQGHVEPNRVVTMRAETSGQIAEIVAEEGRSVQANEVLVRIKMNDRRARLKKAQALVREWQRAYDGTKRLGEKGHQSQRHIDETYSALQAALAELEEIQLEIRNTTIRAPFDGILETRRVELGDYVAVNGEIATIVDNDPLVVTVQIAQQDVGKIALGDVAGVAFATGQTRDGVVRFIAPRAAEATRTFRVEIEVPNPENRILSGTSAEAHLPTGTVLAHFVSPAVLTLNDAGVVGIKTVTQTNTVAFHPITIVLAEAGGVWVSGLPEEARIIAVGQGFVQDGEGVRVSSIRDSSAAAVGSDGPMLSHVTHDLTERPQ